jgi:hypothetical protein
MPVMVGNIADSPWEPLPARCIPCHPWLPWQPLAAFSRPWQLCQPSAATADPWPPLPALGNSWMGDAWEKGVSALTKNRARLQFPKRTLVICKGDLAICIKNKKEKRKEKIWICKQKLSEKQPPCKLQTTPLQFADDTLAICRRPACNLQTTRVHPCNRTWGERGWGEGGRGLGVGVREWGWASALVDLQHHLCRRRSDHTGYGAEPQMPPCRRCRKLS